MENQTNKLESNCIKLFLVAYEEHPSKKNSPICNFSLFMTKALEHIPCSCPEQLRWCFKSIKNEFDIAIVACLKNPDVLSLRIGAQKLMHDTLQDTKKNE